MTRDEIATIVRQGTGRMPAFPDMGARNINDVAEFLITGKDKGADPKLPNDPESAEVPQRRRVDLSRSRRLSGDHAAVGHAERDRSQRGHDPLEDPVRRISGAGGEGPEEHGQRQLRRPGRHRERAGVHRRHELRQEVPRLRQADGRAAVGDDAAGGRQRHAVDLLTSTAASTSSSRAAAARTARRRAAASSPSRCQNEGRDVQIEKAVEVLKEQLARAEFRLSSSSYRPIR